MPPQSPVKILFVGDMHLGRRASRIPDRVWTLGGLEPHDLSPLGTWRRVVQAALDEQVQLVALAGDLVHQDDDLFEARAHLEAGIKRLTAAGIAVAAVAGNHDTRILPALAQVIGNLHLLGPGGTWSSLLVDTGVRLVGWSFPARHHSLSPLREAPPAPEAGVVTLGLLHADLDAARSDYAPVSRRELELVGYQGWCLGHIHLPDPVPDAVDPRRPFYLGSISGSIPTESGAHGPVLATINPDGAVHWVRLPLAPLRWEAADLAVDNLDLGRDQRDQAAHLRDHLLQRVQELALDTRRAGPETRALGLRLRLTGHHPAADVLHQVAGALDREDLVTLVEGRVVFVERITCDAQVSVDLAGLARRGDPVGLVARQIISLEAAAADSEALVARARLVVDQLNAPPELEYQAWTDDDLRTHLIRVGRETLNALLNQNGGRLP